MTILAFLGFSIGLGYLIQTLLANYHVPVDIPAWLAYLIIFGLIGLINLTVLPLPFGVAIMLVAAAHWNPVLVALAASLGGSLGEFTSYFFGYLGKRVAINEDTAGYKLVQNWINKYGMWAISLLALQPVIPFELGGFIAGITRMPVRKFLPAIFIGKFPKYLIIIYLGNTIMQLFPAIHFG